MHGQRLIAIVLDQVLEVARRHGSKRVLGVRLCLPEGGHLEKEGFLEQLELASHGTVAQGAAVELAYAPMPDEHSVLVETVRLDEPDRKRLRLSLFGAVQGVGFRPFVHRLASELGLAGWVFNGSSGVQIEIEGPESGLRAFERRVAAEKPEAAVVAAVEATWLEPCGESGFVIRESDGAKAKSAWLLPDLAACAECVKETLHPRQRRAWYPFTNCTRCGPRFTIITAIPYDRPNTAMASFKMCAACAREYSDPADRRFHAQPIACPACGPRLWLEEKGTRVEADALGSAARFIEQGKIVAIKGIGGFHLICDARSDEAVRLLRSRKRREQKPFALMFPTLESVRQACEVSPLEANWLLSPAAPIVLLRKRPSTRIADGVAPDNPRLGAFLPYTPLHHLLTRRLGFPVVATSGNLSEEPMAKSNDEARERLGELADAYLMHDRPIARHADDSIVRLARGRQSVLRRARGLAPLPLPTAERLKPILALGAHLKSTVSIGWDRQIVTSQHLGDLETSASWEAFEAAVKDLCSLYDFKPEAVACDLHPDYRSTQFAETLGLPVIRIQHHHAHIAACMAEQGIEPPVLGVAWDGIGLGADGTLWGGEFLEVTRSGFERVAHLRPFPLPGGSAAIREPRRAALGLMMEGGFDPDFLRGRFERDWETLKAVARRERLSPMTSSVGRLFDAVASILGLAQVNSFEGQAAMALEHSLEGWDTDEAYGFGPKADWFPVLKSLLADAAAGVPVGLVSARFHNALAELILGSARRFGLKTVVLSGGVFQNAYLTEKAAALLEEDGFSVFTHQRLPANDGGISAGQAYVAGLGWHHKETPCV